MSTGLGRKSVACIMLLCLRMREFPVDVNVGRICSRLGWIPLDVETAAEVTAFHSHFLHPVSHLLMLDQLHTVSLHYRAVFRVASSSIQAAEAMIVLISSTVTPETDSGCLQISVPISCACTVGCALHPAHKCSSWQRLCV